MSRPTEEARAQWLAEQLHGQSCVRITMPILTVTDLGRVMRRLEKLCEELRLIHNDPESLNGHKVIDARTAVRMCNKDMKGGVHYRGAR